MYNQDRKNEYFNYVERMHGSVISRKYIFSSLASIEETWGKDICDFTLPEILMVMATFNSSSRGALIKNLSILKTYTDWCCMNKLSIDNINHYEEVDASKLDIYVNKITSKIVSREELYTIMQQFLNKSDQFIVLALFEGVRTLELGELMMLKVSDIDAQTRTITFPNNTKRLMSKKLYELAIESSEEDEYVTVAEDGDLFRCKLLCDGYIVNSRANSKHRDVKAYERRISDRLRKLRILFEIPYITVPRLKMSGLVEEYNNVLDKYNITKEELFGQNYEQYIKSINPNYDLADLRKNDIKARIYSYIKN